MLPLKLAGAAASAVALWLAFFPGWGPVVWIALVPLFLALHRAPSRGWGATLGATFGAAFFVLEALGLGGLRVVVGLGGVAAVVAGIGAAGGILGAGFGALAARGGVLRIASGWVWFEALRALLPIGIPMGITPLALAGGPLMGAAALAGGWSLSLAVAVTNASLARFAVGLRPRFLLLAGLPPAVLGLIAGVLPPLERAGELTLALVQPGMTLAERFGTPLEDLMARYASLLSSVPRGANLIVLPEDALPVSPGRTERVLRWFGEEARRLGAPLLVGTWDEDDGRYYNTAFYVAPGGPSRPVHRKVRLLPFGEYVPGRALWERMGFGEVIRRFLPREVAPGRGLRPFGPYGALICSESMYPGLARELVRKGAGVILVLTNDSWFAGRVPWEHFLFCSLRAAETGRAVLQAAVTGITGGFDPRGRSLGRLPPTEKGALVVRAPISSGLTPYARLGDGPVLALAALLGLLSFIGPLSPRRRNRSARIHPPPTG